MSTVDEIQRDLACPQCEYNLRGLRGAVVVCPECGCECDVAHMIAQRWTKPWHQAPGLSTIYAPTAWAVIAGLFLTPCFVHESDDWSLRLIVLSITAFGWLLLMLQAAMLFRDGSGLRMALLSHAIFAGYIVGVVPIFTMLIMAAIALLSRHDSVSFPWFVLMVLLSPVGVMLINLGRRAERAIGERCIRLYLNRQPRS